MAIVAQHLRKNGSYFVLQRTKLQTDAEADNC